MEDKSRYGIVRRWLDLQRRRNLHPELAELTIDNFSRSDEVCDCQFLKQRHYKLVLDDILICPIILAIRWARLNLNGYRIEFDPKENIRKSL